MTSAPLELWRADASLEPAVAMLAVSWASDRLQKRKRFVWPPLLIAALAFYASYALGSQHFWASYALLVLAGACTYAPYGPFFAIVHEPLPADSPLLQLDKLVVTPHIGSATHETREAMARCAVDNLLAALAGERPANLVNPAAWARRGG